MSNPYFRRRDWQPADLAQFQRTLVAAIESPRSTRAHKMACESELAWVNAALYKRRDCRYLEDARSRPHHSYLTRRQPA